MGDVVFANEGFVGCIVEDDGVVLLCKSNPGGELFPANRCAGRIVRVTKIDQIDFFTWMKFGIPVVIVMLPMAWIMLTKIIFPAWDLKIGDAGSVIKSELAALGTMSKGEKAVAMIFVCAALGWIFRKQLVALTGLPINDTSIALLAALALGTGAEEAVTETSVFCD